MYILLTCNYNDNFDWGKYFLNQHILLFGGFSVRRRIYEPLLISKPRRNVFLHRNLTSREGVQIMLDKIHIYTENHRLVLNLIRANTRHKSPISILPYKPGRRLLEILHEDEGITISREKVVVIESNDSRWSEIHGMYLLHVIWED